MAGTWRIYPDLRTTYQNPLTENGQVQECGRATDPGMKVADVVAWAALRGSGGDYICTGKETLFVQAAAAC